MVLTTGTLNPEVLRSDLKDVWGIRMNQYEDQWKQIYMDQDSSKNFERHYGVSGFGLVPKKTQGGDLVSEDPYGAFTKDIVNVAYALGFDVTREMIMFEQYGIISDLTNALADSVNVTVDTLAVVPLNTGYSSTASGVGDGKVLFATDHPLGGGSTGTASNTAATPADLSPAALKQDLINIRTTMAKDEAGKKISLKGVKLIVTPDNQFTASEILNSTLLADTAENNDNSLKNILELHVNDYLTDADAYFIGTDASKQPIMQKAFYPADLQQDNDFKSQNMRMSTYFNIGFGFVDFRSMYGNPGA